MENNEAQFELDLHFPIAETRLCVTTRELSSPTRLSDDYIHVSAVGCLF